MQMHTLLLKPHKGYKKKAFLGIKLIEIRPIK